MRSFLPLLLLLGAATEAEAQRQKRCTGSPPDSAWMVAAPVYRDCEVETAARLLRGEGRLNVAPGPSGSTRSGCLVVEMEFVVDTLGRVELGTARTTRADSRELEAAVQETLVRLEFRPARREDRPVRQMVVHRRSIQLAVTVGGGSPTMARTSAPRCN